MGSALILPQEGPKPRSYSHTPKSNPALRVIVMPYCQQHLALRIDQLFETCGHPITDWRLVLDHDPRWIFVIDTNRISLDPERDYVHNSTFDFRSMLSKGH